MGRLQIATIGWLVLAIGGCGGGGGGSSSGNNNVGGGGGPAPTNSPGTADIIFPWSASAATTGTVSVNGTASDADGVSSITVNGVAATTTVTGSEITWSAKVQLASGANAITVSVEDNSGVVTQNADSVTVNYVEVPITFTLDPDATRVVGLTSTLTSTGIVQNLVEHNYSTGEQTVLGDHQGSPSLTCFRRFDDEFLSLQLDGGGNWDLHRFDLASGQDAVLSNVPGAFLDGGTDFNPGSVRSLVCGDTHPNAYVLVNFVAVGEQSYSKSRVIEIDLAAPGFSTLTESDPAELPPWVAADIALDDDRIVALRDISPLAPLTSISITDGTRSELTPGLNIGGFVLHPEVASDLVYVATFDGIDEIRLNAGTRQNISTVGADDPLTFAQIRAIGFDAANNRVVVGDESLDMLIAVDVSTGERSDFVSRRMGTGSPLIVPRKLAISDDSNRAYVLDDGGNAVERLFEIDLETGDRREIGDVGQAFNYLAKGLALDEAGRRAFVAFRHRILEVNLDSGQTDELAHVDTTVLEQIGNLMFDAENNRLLVGDSVNDGIYSLDLGSGLVDVVSRDGDRGAGATFGTLVSFSGATAANEVFAAGQASGTLFRVDLQTGDREALSTTCDLGGASGFQGLMQVAHNASENELLILADRLYSLKLDTNECDSLPANNLLLEVQPASAEQLLAVAFGALLQYDRDSGETVIISK